jgi:hypothetical protein
LPQKLSYTNCGFIGDTQISGVGWWKIYVGWKYCGTKEKNTAK